MRRLLTLLSALSLLLCGAAGVMWWRSGRHAPLDEDRISWLTSSGDRMTIRSDAGRVTLFEPPAWNGEAVAQWPWCREGWWGRTLATVEVVLADADAAVVTELLDQAHARTTGG